MCGHYKTFIPTFLTKLCRLTTCISQCAITVVYMGRKKEWHLHVFQYSTTNPSAQSAHAQFRTSGLLQASAS